MRQVIKLYSREKKKCCSGEESVENNGGKEKRDRIRNEWVREKVEVAKVLNKMNSARLCHEVIWKECRKMELQIVDRDGGWRG